jgi:1-acyl-sn-glycerol-3-phosphate acyltransferase
MVFRGLDRLKESLRQSAGILLTPNHCRWSDPLVVAILGLRLRQYFYYVTSYHQFKQGRFTAWVTNRLGGYSILREGADRQALRASAEILSEGDRPLVLFPEGTWFRMNDKLGTLQDGVGLITRQAARAGTRPILVHPVAIKYWALQDPRPALSRRLQRLETALSWPPQDHLDLIPRIEKLGSALLALKEVQYFGAPRDGELEERIRLLVEERITQLEKASWDKNYEDGALKRIRRLRQLLVRRLPEVVGEPDECRATHQALDDLLFCENLCSYSLDYVRRRPSLERQIEAVLRIEETISDHINESIVPMGVVVEIGSPLAVNEFGGARGAARTDADPLTQELTRVLQGQLDRLVNGGPPKGWNCPPATAIAEIGQLALAGNVRSMATNGGLAGQARL